MDDFTISNDSKWIGFRGLSPNRYKRGITPENIYSDLYLLEAATGTIERLTNNAEVGESGLELLARQSRRWRSRRPTTSIDLRHEQQPRLPPRRSPIAASRSASSATPSTATSRSASGPKDGSTIYFNEGIKATNQVVSLDVRYNTVRPLTEEKASVSIEAGRGHRRRC